MSFCYASQGADRQEDHSVFAGISFPCAFVLSCGYSVRVLGCGVCSQVVVLASHNMLLLRTIDLILYIFLSLRHVVRAHFMFESTQNITSQMKMETAVVLSAASTEGLRQV